MTSLLRDIRYAVRTYARTPGFTAIAVLVLAIGIGANSAMFTLVNALLFKPLSGQAGALLGVFSRDRTRPDDYRAFSYPNYADIRAGTADIFDGLMAHTFAMVGISAGDTTRRSFVSMVSSNYFDTLGVRLAAGRPFSADEERPAATIPVVVANYDAWRAAGFDPAFVGRRIRINATDFTVVGVAPEGFTGTMALVAPEMWLPLGMFDTVVNDMFKNRGTGLRDRGNHGLNLAGRLKPGVSEPSAAARLDVVSRQLEQAYPDENRNQALSTNPLPRLSTSTEPQSNAGPAVGAGLLMAISGVVLVIACLNIANMLLARGTARQKEIAVRLALGSGRGRVVRQLVTEAVLLAAAGSAVGLLLAFWATSLLSGSLAGVLPLTLTFDPTPDVNVMLATTAIAALATVLFGIGPALRISRADLVTDLKSNTGSPAATGGRSAFSARNLLVVGQIALSLALLCTGGLFARGAIRAAAADPGFRYDRLLLVSLDPSMAAYDEAGGRRAYRAVLDRIRTIAGVEAAGFASTVPFGEFDERLPVEAVGGSQNQDGRRSPTYRIIGADYFQALGLRMMRGREFTPSEEESASAPRVAIVDEMLARRLFPTQDPLGQMIRITRREQEDRGTGSTGDGEPMQIVGIAAPLRDTLFDREPVPHLYVPWGRNYRASMNVHVRMAAPAAAASDLLAVIRKDLDRIDDRVPVLNLVRMQQFHDRSLELWAVRAGGQLVISLGALALLLAWSACTASSPTSCLSARGKSASAWRSGQGRLKCCGWCCPRGLADGCRSRDRMPLAALIGLASSRLLYDVSPIDPIVFTLGPLTLAIAAIAAAWIPARRATRVTPVIALRAD